MKNTIVTILLVLALFLFVACSNELETSDISNPSSESEISLIESIADDGSGDSTSSESEEVIEIVPEKIIYNPDATVTNHIFEITNFMSGKHNPPYGYLRDHAVADDEYFCIMIYNHTSTFVAETTDFHSYLKSVGFIANEELTREMTGSTFAESDVVVGYVNREAYEKLCEDDLPMMYDWLAEDCVENKCWAHSYPNEQ
ncbi:MAG: hypothetical protein IKK70_07690 [Clostridia bacterium]|nr:hypothetical protein [Clostridia bacterium]